MHIALTSSTHKYDTVMIVNGADESHVCKRSHICEQNGRDTNDMEQEKWDENERSKIATGKTKMNTLCSTVPKDWGNGANKRKHYC